MCCPGEVVGVPYLLVCRPSQPCIIAPSFGAAIVSFHKSTNLPEHVSMRAGIATPAKRKCSKLWRGTIVPSCVE